MLTMRLDRMSDLALISESTPAVAPLKVLLAEDNVTNQKLAVAILSKHGHSVTVVENGRQAVAQHERERFDLILMDMQMPEMDGIEATEAIRIAERKSGGRIPIIAVTANAMLGDRERCLVAGMDDYLSKPLRAEELVRTIRRLVKPPLFMNTNPNQNQAANRDTVAETFDYVASVHQVEGDADLLAQLVAVFLGQLPSLLPSVADAVIAGDALAVRKAAHALSSSVSVLVAPRARNSARRLELMAVNGDLTEARQAHEELVAEFDALARVLNTNPQFKAA